MYLLKHNGRVVEIDPRDGNRNVVYDPRGEVKNEDKYFWESEEDLIYFYENNIFGTRKEKPVLIASKIELTAETYQSFLASETGYIYGKCAYQKVMGSERSEVVFKIKVTKHYNVFYKSNGKYKTKEKKRTFEVGINANGYAVSVKTRGYKIFDKITLYEIGVHAHVGLQNASGQKISTYNYLHPVGKITSDTCMWSRETDASNYDFHILDFPDKDAHDGTRNFVISNCE